ncbi:hypothetical protein GCM10009555_079590 [Acrocarpospora macrocephala]|uniref:Uncharacterized protein n=1 Tax=Acrocarpospora macrocephala TaxID=150177 RepID=A0A5M3WYC1_9ACTN|nr:hypothetical protein Amac_075410 [Acrocarpospora macrocephala]
MIFPTTSPGGLAAFAALDSADNIVVDDAAARADPVTAEAKKPRRETVTCNSFILEGSFTHVAPAGGDRVGEGESGLHANSHTTRRHEAEPVIAA